MRSTSSALPPAVPCRDTHISPRWSPNCWPPIRALTLPSRQRSLQAHHKRRTGILFLVPQGLGDEEVVGSGLTLVLGI